MRFVVGLIAGAMTTMLVATAMDAPTADVMQRAAESWRAISARLQPAPSGMQAPAPPAVAPDEAEDGAATERSPEPVTPLSAPSADQQDSVSTAERTSGEAVVWSPFHSEASATGFARRLSSQLAHPFEVRKQGPASYVVVYRFNDEHQRLALQQQISQVTGGSSS